MTFWDEGWCHFCHFCTFLPAKGEKKETDLSTLEADVVLKTLLVFLSLKRSTRLEGSQTEIRIIS